MSLDITCLGAFCNAADGGSGGNEYEAKPNSIQTTGKPPVAPNNV